MRLTFVGVLGRFHADAGRVGPALGRILRHDQDARIREAAVGALLRLRHFDPALVAALEDEDAVVREAATGALERTGGLGHWAAVLALVAAMSDSDARVREGAFYALDHRADGTVPTLITALGSNDLRMRHRAAELMSFLWEKAVELDGDRLEQGLRDEAVPVLRVSLTDRDPEVRQAAAAALSRIETSRAKEKKQE
jgi:HEAT repeat protein